MKFVPVLAFLTLSVMVVMIYQAVQQELGLRNLKARMFESSVQLKQKEHAIIEEKNKIQELNKQLTPLNNKKEELNKKKVDIRSCAAMLKPNDKTCSMPNVCVCVCVFLLSKPVSW
ncbi:hypothetical protein CRUP_034902, partial [Coryphaenoides rupestris]